MLLLPLLVLGSERRVLGRQDSQQLEEDKLRRPDTASSFMSGAQKTLAKLLHSSRKISPPKVLTTRTVGGVWVRSVGHVVAAAAGDESSALALSRPRTHRRRNGLSTSTLKSFAQPPSHVSMRILK